MKNGATYMLFFMVYVRGYTMIYPNFYVFICYSTFSQVPEMAIDGARLVGIAALASCKRHEVLTECFPRFTMKNGDSLCSIDSNLKKCTNKTMYIRARCICIYIYIHIHIHMGVVLNSFARKWLLLRPWANLARLRDHCPV